MDKDTAYIVYRVLKRLDVIATDAFGAGRVADACSMWRLIGQLEYMHFEVISTERSLERIA